MEDEDEAVAVGRKGPTATWMGTELAVDGSDSTSGATGPGPFGKLGLSVRTCRAVFRMGFVQPTPVQRRCIPAILRAEGDVVATAQTGSGKTAAFLLPMVERLSAHSKVVGARGLVVSPTRELAMQTGRVCLQALRGTDLQVCYLIGGMSMEKQFEHLAANPDILVVTPGRLVHHLEETKYSLDRVELAVFDEADKLFELGMESELTHILTAMERQSKQLVLMSATLPTSLVEFAKVRLVQPTFIQQDANRTLPDTLTLKFYYVRADDKTAALLWWLAEHKPQRATVLIFCATAHHVAFLAELINASNQAMSSKTKRGGRIGCVQVYGGLTQTERDESLKAFSNGKATVLLATDVAARGLDIKALDYVINFDFPCSAKLFVHRTGRTARQNLQGTAISFVTKDDLPYAVELLLFLGRKFGGTEAPISKEEKPAGVVAQASKDLNGTERIGGLPSDTIDIYREIVFNALNKDADIARLYRSMCAGHREYLRFRPSASKMSMRRAVELVQCFGGPQALAESVHADFIKSEKIKGTVVFADNDRIITGLDDIFKRKREAAPKTEIIEDKIATENGQVTRQLTAISTTQPDLTQFEDGSNEELIDLAKLRSFRPVADGKGSKELGVLPTSAVMNMRGILSSRLALREALLRTGNDSEEIEVQSRRTAAEEILLLGDTLEKAKISGSHKQERDLLGNSGSLDNDEAGDFYVKDKAALIKAGGGNVERSFAMEAELSLNARVSMECSALDLPDEKSGHIATGVSTLASGNKLQHVMKWNPRRKRYEVMAIDPTTRKVMKQKQKRKNDAGAAIDSNVNSGRGSRKKVSLYEKWVRESGKRIPRAGQEEDQTNRIRRRHEREAAAAAAQAVREEDGETAGVGPGVSWVDDLESYSRDSGLAEKIKRNVQLTHKEQRKVRRVMKLVKQPVTINGEKGGETRSLGQLRTLHAQQRKKAKIAKLKRMKRPQKKQSKAVFMAKKNIAIYKQNQMTKSFILRRK